jgi:hypothetical protein
LTRRHTQLTTGTTGNFGRCTGSGCPRCSPPLLADQLFRLLRELGLRRPFRIGAWVAVVGCSPILVFSSQIYPELPGALLLVVALRVMVSRAPPAALALGSTAAAGLVWLHVRYFPLSIGAIFGLGLAACAARRGSLGGPRNQGALDRIRAIGSALVACAVKDWRTATLPIVVPYVLVLGALAAAFQHWYGTPNPTAPYRAFSTTSAGDAGWSFPYDYVLPDILSPVYGWIPFVPVHWLGLAALGCLVVRFGWPAAGCLAVAVGYEFILASAAPNIGWGLPARYLVVVMPLIAVPIAVVLQYVRLARLAFVPLLAASLLFALGAAHDYQGLYPIDDASRVFGVRTIAPAFPVPHPRQLPTGFVLDPGKYPPQTGKVVQQRLIEAKAGRDMPGFLLWGPYSALRDGVYRVTFPLAASGVPPHESVATVEVVGSPPQRILAAKQVPAAELKPRDLTGISFEFGMPGGYLVETRLFYRGLGTLKAGPVTVEPVRLEPKPRSPPWALASLWVGGTVLVGWLFVDSMLRRRRIRHCRDDELIREQ